MYFPIVAFTILLLAIFLVFFIRGLNKKKGAEEIGDIITGLSESDRTPYIDKIFQHERFLVEKFNIPSSRVRVFVYAERILIIGLVVLSCYFFGIIGIAVAVAAILLTVMDKKKKEEIEKSGVTRIQDTVAFMDFFTPQIASGSSATQAFTAYIQKLDDDNPAKELLIEYWDAQENEDYSYDTPTNIRDITSVYENARYNEEQGTDDYLYIIEEAKTDLFQKSLFYADYNSKVSEVLKPIEWAYYIGVPAIILLLYGTMGDFWFTIYGWITAIVLVVLFFLFKLCCNKLAINTMREIL